MKFSSYPALGLVSTVVSHFEVLHHNDEDFASKKNLSWLFESSSQQKYPVYIRDSVTRICDCSLDYQFRRMALRKKAKAVKKKAATRKTTQYSSALSDWETETLPEGSFVSRVLEVDFSALMEYNQLN